MRTLLLLSLFGAAGLCAADLSSLLVPLEPAAGPAVRVDFQPPEGVAEAPEKAPPPQAAKPPSSFRLREAALLRALQEAAEERFAPEGELHLRLVRPWEPLALPSKDWSLTLLEAPADGLASRMNLRFALECDGERKGEFLVVVEAEHWVDVLVARGRIGRRDALAPELFFRQRSDVLRLNAAPLPVEEELADYELTRSLSAGQVLTERALQPKPLVRKGDVVDVIARDGVLLVTTKALALEDGAAGQFISVRNMESKRDIQARVLEDSRCEVFF